MAKIHITGVAFKRYKAFSEFSLPIHKFNVLVGPNNAGKSTVISAFRILSEGIRRARARRAEPLDIEGFRGWGYRLNLEELPIASENIFHNYDDSRPAEVRFRTSSGSALRLHFPAQGFCYLICDSQRGAVRTPSEFRKQFDFGIGFVPVLGPVEHDEPLYQKEAARMALLAPGASRNFRNIWYHFPEGFDDFRNLVRTTWPGMDIQAPEAQLRSKGSTLCMFCPEERIPREIYWAGYGFQVWCQMLTHIVKAKEVSLLVIDEPDIYLHSDLQRQLVALLQELPPDILIATHSTEIISEADPGALLAVNKKWRSARPLKDASHIKSLFATLGSNLNPVLTQIAKTRRVVFVEGTDFQILSAFARKAGKDRVANRADFAIVPLDGFNPHKVVDLSKIIELTIGAPIQRAVILDRDYRSTEEVAEVKSALGREVALIHVHPRKELENYLLTPDVIQRVVELRLVERVRRTGEHSVECPDIGKELEAASISLKSDVAGQFLARHFEYLKRKHPGTDFATTNAVALRKFEALWENLETRLEVVPGKQLLARLNQALQEKLGVSVSALQIAQQHRKPEIPKDLVKLMDALEAFRKTETPN